MHARSLRQEELRDPEVLLGHREMSRLLFGQRLPLRANLRHQHADLQSQPLRRALWRRDQVLCWLRGVSAVLQQRGLPCGHGLPSRTVPVAHAHLRDLCGLQYGPQVRRGTMCAAFQGLLSGLHDSMHRGQGVLWRAVLQDVQAPGTQHHRLQPVRHGQ